MYKLLKGLVGASVVAVKPNTLQPNNVRPFKGGHWTPHQAQKRWFHHFNFLRHASFALFASFTAFTLPCSNKDNDSLSRKWNTNKHVTRIPTYLPIYLPIYRSVCSNEIYSDLIYYIIYSYFYFYSILLYSNSILSIWYPYLTYLSLHSGPKLPPVPGDPWRRDL